MKSFHKLFAITIALLVFSYANAQISSKRVEFQINGGLNISNLSATDHDGDYYDNAIARVGYNVGTNVDFALGKGMYIRSGLALTAKGAEVEDMNEDYYGRVDATMNAVYLQVPLYFTYKFNFPYFNKNKLGFSAGPYFAYGIAGKTTLTGRSNRGSGTGAKYNTFNDDGLWNKPEVGLGFDLFFELDRLVFTWGAEFGITKAWKRSHMSENLYVRNNNTYLTVGFKL